MRAEKRPRALLVQPPVYDFALYDLFFKPFGLLRIGNWLAEGGYEVRLLNGLDYRDLKTTRRYGQPRRNRDGTGKFPKRHIGIDERVPGSSSSFQRFRRRFGEESGRYINRYGMDGESLAEKLSAERPDIVLVTSQMTYWYPGVVEIFELVREYLPRVPAAVGGVYASLLPEHCGQATGAEAVIEGDGGTALSEFLRDRSLPVPPGPVPPSPFMLPGIWEDAGVLRLNRGCPLNCSYCASKLIEAEFVRGNGEELWELVKEMNRRFGTRSFAFYDDALLMDKRRAVLPFLERAASEDHPYRFFLPNAVHFRYLDRETALLMKKAGFAEVRLGYETADDSSSASSMKYVRSDVPGVIDSLLSAGFSGEKILLYILAGLPGQTSEEVEETLERASRLGVKMVLAQYSPVPGTALWSESVQKSAYPIEREPLFQNNTIFPMAWKGFDRGEMERLKRRARELSRRVSHE